MTQPTDALVSEPPVASIIAETTEIRKCIIIVPADGKFYVPDGSTKDCRILIGYTMEDAILVLMGKQPATTDYTEGRAYAGAQCYAVTQPQQRNVTLNTLANELREEAASDEHGHGPWFREIADTIDRLTRELREARQERDVSMQAASTALEEADAARAELAECRKEAVAAGEGWNAEEQKRQTLQVKLDAVVSWRVEVREMKESHRTTWWVCLIRSDCPDKVFATPADGYITPYVTEQQDQAIHEAGEWAAFLKAPEPKIRAINEAPNV